MEQPKAKAKRTRLSPRSRRGRRVTPRSRTPVRQLVKLLTPSMQYPIFRGYRTPTTPKGTKVANKSYAKRNSAGHTYTPKGENILVAGRKHRRFRAESNRRESYLPAVERFMKQPMEQQAKCIRLMTSPVAQKVLPSGKVQDLKALRLSFGALAKRVAYAGVAPYVYALDSRNEVKKTFRMAPSYAVRTAGSLYKLKVDKGLQKEYNQAKQLAFAKGAKSNLAKAKTAAAKATRDAEEAADELAAAAEAVEGIARAASKSASGTPPAPVPPAPVPPAPARKSATPPAPARKRATPRKKITPPARAPSPRSRKAPNRYGS